MKTLPVNISWLLLLRSCISPTPAENQEKPAPAITLFGRWDVLEAALNTSLTLEQDSTYYVDIEGSDGIEIAGTAILEAGNKITFINTSGTDATASNPYPGVYFYTHSKDTAHFSVVDDTLKRRIHLLTTGWIRK